MRVEEHFLQGQARADRCHRRADGRGQNLARQTHQPHLRHTAAGPVDGVDVRDWNLASLRSQISIIEQDIFLFSRSLSDNIAFGKPGATKEEIIAASICPGA
jgi:ABC-type protease/lipase transport system fused ATPase/permease subunit